MIGVAGCIDSGNGGGSVIGGGINLLGVVACIDSCDETSIMSDSTKPTGTLLMKRVATSRILMHIVIL